MTVTTTEADQAQTAGRNPRDYVPAQVWDREIKLLVRDNPFDTVMAERLLGQGIAYLITAMEKYGQGLELGCGELVDTAVPEIDRKYDGTVERTADIVAASGFPVDRPLWEHDFSKCSPCSPGTNCH